MRKHSIFPAALFTVIFVFLIGATVSVQAYQWGPFGYSIKGDSKSVKLKVPKISLTAAEEQDLYNGKPITRLLDSPDGLKRGYLRFFAPYDPVTVWMVVTNAKNFAKTDPSFPKTGSTFEKKAHLHALHFPCRYMHAGWSGNDVSASGDAASCPAQVVH